MDMADDGSSKSMMINNSAHFDSMWKYTLSEPLLTYTHYTPTQYLSYYFIAIS